MSLPSCSIGEIEESDCHSIAHTHGKTRLIPITEYSPEDTDLIVWRTEIRKNNLKTICLHHQKLYLEKFASRNHFCANPFGHHDENKKIKEMHTFLLNQWGVNNNFLDSACATYLLEERNLRAAPFCEQERGGIELSKMEEHLIYV